MYKTAPNRLKSEFAVPIYFITFKGVAMGCMHFAWPANIQQSFQKLQFHRALLLYKFEYIYLVRSYQSKWFDMFLIIKIKWTINTLQLNLDKFKLKTIWGEIKYYLGGKKIS